MALIGLRRLHYVAMADAPTSRSHFQSDNQRLPVDLGHSCTRKAKKHTYGESP